MKNILLPPIFVLFFTTSVSAQEQARAAAEINTSAKTLLATKAHLDDLVNNVIPALGNRKASLDSDATALKTDVADAKARQDAFGRDIADQEAAIERHNKNRCEAPVNDPKRCAAYNAETEALGQRSAALRRKQADLNAAAQDLRARSNQLDSDVRDWVAGCGKGGHRLPRFTHFVRHHSGPTRRRRRFVQDLRQRPSRARRQWLEANLRRSRF